MIFFTKCDGMDNVKTKIQDKVAQISFYKIYLLINIVLLTNLIMSMDIFPMSLD
jgi:hypothetical protein